MYILLDANVTAGYYLPRSLNSRRVAERIEILFDSVRSGATKHFFYIPNFCVAEVFSVFMKYAYGHWNRQVKKAGGTIDKRIYERLIRQFQNDIHNGRFLYHYELSRYHVLGINLVAPVDHYFKFTHHPKSTPMGTFDHLIISMGIHLAHIHGSENAVIVSSDKRLTDILEKCRGGLPQKTIDKLKLNIAEEVTGRPFSAAVFPKCCNLRSMSNKELEQLFGEWPLPINGKIRGVNRYV